MRATTRPLSLAITSASRDGSSPQRYGSAADDSCQRAAHPCAFVLRALAPPPPEPAPHGKAKVACRVALLGRAGHAYRRACRRTAARPTGAARTPPARSPSARSAARKRAPQSARRAPSPSHTQRPLHREVPNSTITSAETSSTGRIGEERSGDFERRGRTAGSATTRNRLRPAGHATSFDPGFEYAGSSAGVRRATDPRRRAARAGRLYRVRRGRRRLERAREHARACADVDDEVAARDAGVADDRVRERATAEKVPSARPRRCTVSDDGHGPSPSA